MTAAERWREQLRAWAIPEEILAAAPESPYEFPTELFRRRALPGGLAVSTPTTLRAREALPEDGVVLDVGVGGGGTSLPLADRASRIVGVDQSVNMLKVFGGAAAAVGDEAAGDAAGAVGEAGAIRAETDGIRGTWPDIAGQVPPADVVVCGHVLYNVQELEPFVRELNSHARRRVVVEITERHPWAWMHDLWLRFHQLERPDGPTADDAVSALVELGVRARREDHPSVQHAGFERRKDAIALIRRRLCLPSERDAEIEKALGDRLSEEGALWSAGPPSQTLVTLFWDPGADG